MNQSHAPVMQQEVIDGLAIRPDGNYVDGTYGRGGHARSILAALGENGRLIVMDRDPQAIADARELLGSDHRVTIIHDEYASMPSHIADLDLLERIDGILLDLGVSSPQLDDATRGFSFQHKGPLDMRMNPESGQSAAQWLGQADEAEIARVLWEYGEERYSRRIAKKIVEQRASKPIEDTATLAALISAIVPRPKNNRHPATRSFQAIRIHVNQELTQIQLLLESVVGILRIGGRLLVISFHSLEDRLVKRFFKANSSRARLPRGLPLRDSELDSVVPLKLVGRAVRAGARELAANPRARSAVLRIAERAA
ncbi:MAG: 16S rRNA (cytosine(1402)-N(4))-methyltransferase RsmH [Gammaproteobacteria bacterium]|nr:MAG: 16S rRNA (cytosine(1402)-N(4))-methyltransferase RsmH [Gammaproteobacteria bacterium]UCH41598.1 MAG: 16S rRNA (cytosine(1402)-N(4))-methyltransferase RsmH [Gammaproteobacteria bacterium]